MSTHDDHATLIDSIDRIPLVYKLASEVMTCTPPRVFGVHGDWGAGKTSFLHQLHHCLDGIVSRKDWTKQQDELFNRLKARRSCRFPEQKYSTDEDAVVIWFEAWRYQHEPSPVVALLHEIRGQLGTLVRVKNWGKKIAEVTIRSGLLQLEQIAKFAWLQSASGITVAAGGAGLAATVQEQGERWEREHLAEKLPAEAIREQLEHAFEQLLGREKGKKVGEGRRVVVLIDDLDRCEPQATYRLLEGIKIYLNIPNCVFVLGMDQRIIEDAIAESAPGAKDKPDVARRRAREYLEKLFQEVYHLPIVQDVPTQLLAWLRDDFGKVSQTTRDDLEALLNEYPGCLPANPRKIKAFGAVLWRFLTEPDQNAIAAADFTALPEYTKPAAKEAEPAAKQPYLSLVLIMASLYHFHPEVYRVLEAHTDGFYESLWAWCARSGEDKVPDHTCVAGLERAYKISSPANATDIPLPEMRSLHIDYSRGHVLRIQKLLYHARPFTKTQIQALLLK
jgi:predicted KAP-like P-loop ATPase